MKKLRDALPLRIVLFFSLALVLFSLAGGCAWNQEAGAATKEISSQTRKIPGQALDEETFKIRIMHVNDIHSHLEEIPASLLLNGAKTYLNLGGMGRLATQTKINRAICPRSLLLCAGDAVQGTLYFPTYQGKAEAEFLNLLELDAMVLGNHEFDKGPGFVTGFASMLECPLLGANVVMKDSPDAKIQPYTIKKIHGEKVAVIGLITPETGDISNAGPDVNFLNEIQTAKQYVAELEARGINKIVVLSHLGYGRDIALAKAVSGIDLIVGGHSHTLLGDFSGLGMKPEGPYPTMVMNPCNDPVYVTQAWEWAKGLGTLDVRFNKEGEILACKGYFTLLTGSDFFQKNDEGIKAPVSPEVRQSILDEIAVNPEIEVAPQDPEAMAVLAKFAKGVDAFRKKTVAEVSRDLPHVRVPGSAHAGTGKVLQNGSMIAPLVAESLYWKCRSVGQNVQLSIQNAGGVRTDVQAGTLTVAGVYNLLPFGNTAIILTLKGREVQKAVEEAVRTALAPVNPNPAAFPYLGNARFTLNRKNAPGSRVSSLEFKNDSGDWTSIQENQTYRVSVNAFIANGGDGYSVLAESQGERTDTGFVDAAVFMEYAKAHDPLTPSLTTGVIMK